MNKPLFATAARGLPAKCTSGPRLALLAFILIGLLAASVSRAQRPQERLTGLASRPAPTPIPSPAIAKKAVALPFVDNFDQDSPFPASSRWTDQHVWVNHTQPKGPITMGVASFDGLNRYGRAYALNRRNTTDTTDRLTSRPIDLSNPQDSVYLSFYYQEGGWAEPPVSMDSLRLEFWNGADTTWERAWSASGGQLPVDSFHLVMLPVADRYHRSDFRLRFLSFGSPAGAFDVWHLDYLKLDDGRSFDDTLVQDIAFTAPHPSLLQDYEAIPWFHLNEVLDPSAISKARLGVYYRRNVDLDASRPNLLLGEYDIQFNGTVVDQNGAPDANLDDPHPPLAHTRFTVPDTNDPGRPGLSFLNPPYAGPFSLRSRVYYSGGSQTYGRNDTLRKEQVFENYYAYDDGSAERGFEILNNDGGYIVQRYRLLSTDTLRGLSLHFLPAFYPSTEQTFSIVVLENDGGLPGQVLYESDSLYSPQYSGHNDYRYYLLDTAQALPTLGQTVFIGIRQQSAVPLTLGYDQNRRNKTTAFYGIVSNFYQSFLGGTIMMRPFFRNLPADVSLPEKAPAAQEATFYPNPTPGRIKLLWPKGPKPRGSYQLRSLNGRVVKRGPLKPELQLNGLPEGLYLLELRPQSRPHQVLKVRVSP